METAEFYKILHDLECRIAKKKDCKAFENYLLSAVKYLNIFFLEERCEVLTQI